MFEFRKSLKGSVAFVPTMGALHEGHAKLLERARKIADHVVLSIYVNSTQFNNAEDLKNYPKTWDSDLELAKKMGVDFVFAPSDEDMYPDQYTYRVSENKFSTLLCGRSRPGHFDGVLSVVLKLFNIVQPHFALFGEKDHQQLKLIEGMLQALFVPVQLIAVPTERHPSGLALSSRNALLSPEQMKIAPQLYQSMKTYRDLADVKRALESQGFRIDYVEDYEGRRYIAAFLGSVRLIDNILLDEVLHQPSEFSS